MISGSDNNSSQDVTGAEARGVPRPVSARETPPPSFEEQMKLLAQPISASAPVVPRPSRPRKSTASIQRSAASPAAQSAAAQSGKGYLPATVGGLPGAESHGAGGVKTLGVAPPAGALPASGSGAPRSNWRSRKPFGKTLVMAESGIKVELSLPIQDLSRDEFIVNAPRLEFEGRMIPSLGGIPLLHRLGQGGMGAVYYGLHLGFGREVAVKVLPFHLAQRDPSSIKRFFREARLAAGVRSDHLVHVTDVAQENGISFLVMEFISGKSAAQLVKKARIEGQVGLSERSALDICIAACHGLVDAHAAHIVHRDVKPDNIMIPERVATHEPLYLAAKLADLGLARNEEHTNSMTAANACLGTPGYMAPEQIEDARAAGKPADVFGLGASLYSMLTGEAPFSGDSMLFVMRDTLRKVHTPLRDRRGDISKSTCTLVELCLAKDPTHRYQDASALLRALEACRKALDDPHAAQYLDITRPLLNREPDAPLHVKPVKAQRSRFPRFVWAAIFVLGFLAVGRVIVAMLPAEQQTQHVAAAIDPTKLFENEAKSDAAITEDERVRQLGLVTVSKKLDDLQNSRRQTQESERARTKSEQAEFEMIYAQAKVAADKNDWTQAKDLLTQASSKPGAATSPAAAEVREFESLVRIRAAKQSAETEWSTLLASVSTALAAAPLDEFGHCAWLPLDVRTRLDSDLVRLKNLRAAAPELSALAAKLERAAAFEAPPGNRVELELVPPGEFVMGFSQWAPGTGAEHEHAVRITQPFYIAKAPVTLAAFRRFCDSTQFQTEAEKGDSVFGKGAMACGVKGKAWAPDVSWRNPGFVQHEDHPVVAVSWNDSRAYCEWLAKKSHRTLRLPTEAEWEYAARGPQGWQWPWGNSWEGLKCNHADLSLKGSGLPLPGTAFSTDTDGFVHTSPVNAFPNASWCGATDMAGNVSQWCSDWYSQSYYTVSEPADPNGPEQGERAEFAGASLACRVARGGSYLDAPDMQRATARRRLPPAWRATDTSFRYILAPTPR